MKSQNLHIKGARKLTRDEQKGVLGGTKRRCCLYNTCGWCEFWVDDTRTCPAILEPTSCL